MFVSFFLNVPRNFNVTPIQSHLAEASHALSDLKSKVIVIHGTPDRAVPSKQVEFVTKLAIAERWAPPGTLSFYDDGEGHLMPFDNPKALGSIYRKAFEEQVLQAEVNDRE